MNYTPRLIALMIACCVGLSLRAQNTVFNAALSGDALNAATYPGVTSTTTGWDGLSNKAAAAPTESGNVLTLNMAATTSGFYEAQALFSPSTVTLLPGTYLEVTTTFVPTYVLTNTSDNLIFGLFNSGGSAPLNGLLSSGLTSSLATYATGGAKGWIGYNANIPLSGSPSMKTRAVQTGTNNTVQSVLVDSQSTSVGYSTPAGVSASSIGAMTATFTNGSTYTLDYKLALSSDSATLTATVSLYNGVGTTGTGTNTLVGSYTGKFTTSASTIVTKAFDAFAIGWRADAGQVGNIKISSFTVQTTGGAPWFIAQPPSSLSASLGSSVTLTTSVGGAVSGYQWQVSANGGSTYSNLDTTANPSAATATLTLTNVQYSDAGLYRLVATNAAGSTTSTACTLTVTNTAVAPTITTNPASATVTGGTAQTFSVAANGTAPLTYQWYYSSDNTTFTPIAGATSSSYTISSAALTDEGYYRVVVTNSAGSATSTTAQLTVNQPLTITAQPVGAAINVGGSATLSVTAVGKPTPAYQWYLNGTAVSGATASTYTIASAVAANSGLYTVVVSNSAGDSVTSSGASVAVLSSTLAPGALTPAASATGVVPDTRLTLTFNQAVSIGLTGTIKIYDASNATTPVDTIDLVAANALMKTLRASNSISTQALPVQNKSIGTVTNFNYYPLTVSGNTATIYPRNNVLANNKTYYVTIDPGVFTDSTGLSYAGISSTTGWRFATRTTGPSSGATLITVAADGTGDFCTVQGALDFIPAANTTARTLFIRKGTYFEEIYFTAKHSLTFLGEDRMQTLIVYPNNNNFNNVSGVYHRMVFNADHANNTALVNLSITNSTPKGGAQAEALILNGATTAQAIVSNVTLFSYQDTLQINGQGYITDSRISGDVDFMWGGGPCFFNNCDIAILSSGGYFTQIRNGTSNHGYVFANCRFTASAGVTGTFFGRIDPTSANFPNSETVMLDSKIGDATNGSFLNTTTGVSGSNYLGGWWLLNNVSSGSAAGSVHDWTNSLLNASGAALANPNSDTFTTMPTDATTQANYRNVPWVLGTNLAGTSTFSTWAPALAPQIVASPAAQTISAGGNLTLSVQAYGIPALSYQWYQNGSAISGATAASYSVTSSSALDAGTYYVVVSNGTSSTTTSAVAVVVHNAPPVITLQPANTSGLLGTTATLDVWAAGDTPFSYQWYQNGSPISGATSQSLRLTGLTAASAGNYSVVVSNSFGSTTSNTAALTIVAPATTVPTLPIIPVATFDVTAYGAIGDGATDNTSAIAAAIAAAKAAGGGTIELPPASGAYLCGPITISSNMDLQVDAGAILRALPYGTYPNSTTSPSHFITIASGSSNVEFSGGGTIDGQGAAWWAAFNAGTITARPRLVQITKVTSMLFTGVTFLNSPNFHLAFSGANNNVTLFGVTISAPGDSPNTDGMDVAGTNFLVQNCSVSDGDDNIVAKPGSVFCRNLYIAGCTIGTGHGVSIGGQTNVGLDGMVVTNCTFNGTSSALRMKADPTQGGPVQNVTFSNLTMSNVTYPILFYSYYNLLGSPGATSGSSQITPAKVNTYNQSPPNSLSSSTIPTWKNITLTNITVTNGSGYSTIWGLPTADGLIQNVTFNNVSISGGAGVELYDAANIQFTGTNSVGAFVTDNALAITGQPTGKTINVGDSVTFSATAIGGSGTNNTGLTYQWNLNGAPLTNGVQADGSTISGATASTLAIANARVTGAGNYTVTVSTTLDGYNTSTNALVANSLPVSATSSAAPLTVNPIAASIALSAVTPAYDGTIKTPTVTTAPAGLAVQFAYANNATPLNAGTYAVTATIADPNYTGATSGTFTIVPAALAITADPQTKVYGAIDPSFTFTASGLAASDSAASVLSGALTRTAGENVGGYAIAQGTLAANSNYTLAFTGASLAITPAPLTVTAAAGAKVYGSADPSFLFSVTSGALVSGDSFSGSLVRVAGENVGSYAIMAGTLSAGNNYALTYVGAGLTITPKPASVTPNAATKVYGAADPALTGTLAGFLAADGVTATFARASGETVAGGPYAITAVLNPSAVLGNYAITANPATFTITPATLMITANAQTKIYGAADPALTYTVNGLQFSDTATSVLSGALARAAGENVGSYAIAQGTLAANSNYTIAFTGATLTITPAKATIAVTSYSVIYDGAAHTATGIATGVNGEPLAGLNLGGTTHTNAGTYGDTWTFTDLTGNYANTSGSVSDRIGQAAVTIVLAPLTQKYDGTAKSVIATTTPSGLAVNLTYDGATTAPILPGTHAVVATITDPNYSGTQTDTLTIGVTALINHGVTLDGEIDGSIQVLAAESDTLNGSALISGDLLVPGSPTVQLNGHPTYGSTIDYAGSAAPSTHTITLNGNAVLRHVARRVDALPMLAVTAPPASSQNVVLNGNAGATALAPANYGSLVVNGGSSFVLGVAGATVPAVYNVQSLTLNGSATIQIVGPVMLTLANGVTLNGNVGAPANPAWLTLAVANGGVTLNGNTTVYATIVAPNGTVAISGNAALHGTVTADRLTINGKGLLEDVSP